MIDNYKDLTLEKFEQLSNIDIEMDDMEKMATTIAILSDQTVDEVLNMHIDKFNDCAKRVLFLKESPKTTNKLPDKIIINGKKYRILKDAKDMTAGQYIDFKNYAKKIDEISKNLALILTTVIIPDGKKYGDGYDTLELAEEFKKYINVETAANISNFFFVQYKNYIIDSLTYLEWKMKKTMKGMDKEAKTKMKEAIAESHLLIDLLKNGGGLIGQ